MDKSNEIHILVVPYPSQGHVNPMMQFSKRLVSKGAKTTLAITKYISKTMCPKSDTVTIETISDGCDEAGFVEAESVADYLKRMEIAGTKTLKELVEKYNKSNHPVNCIVYDAFLHWSLDVAKEFGIKGATFFTQACAVNYIYYYVHCGMLKLPVASPPVEIQGLPPLELPDLPSFIYVHGSYPAYFEMVLNQLSTVDKADFVLVNTYYKLEHQVVDAMKEICPILTIGPTVPSFYLDNRVENDNNYVINLFQFDPSISLNWLNSKPQGSVVYVAFGSMGSLQEEQMEEIACSLKNVDFNVLWVVKASEEKKLPKNVVQETSDKCLVVNWSPQLQVLSNKAVGCFFSHGGWNSTIEALSIGVPMVVMPLWTDQTTNAKLVQDVWKVGLRVGVGTDGIARRREIEGCIREVMEGEKGKEMKRNARSWRDLAKEAVSDGGTSDSNIDKFIATFKDQKYIIIALIEDTLIGQANSELLDVGGMLYI